ncbi:AsmA family protein [Herbaspirillum sp. HC18]|nr:AsmA family protein [Herbaspirillum sp. HC18]
MRKTFKYFAIVVAALLVLSLAGAAILAATFNPNDYKPWIIRQVQEKKQRTLAIPGDIKLSFFPKIGADLGKVSISEHGSDTEFAAVEHAKVSLALIPLLSKRFVVDQVHVDGLRATVRRNKDGSTNIDDLLSKGEPGKEGGGGKEVGFDIDGVHLSNAHIVFDDRQQARKIDISRLNLDTGKIAGGVPGKLQLGARVKGNQPDIDADVAVKTGFTFDLDKKEYALKGLDANVKGRVAGFTDLDLKLAGDADLKPETRRFVLDGIKLSANGKHAGEAIKAKFDIPKLALTDKQVSGGKLSGEFDMSAGARKVTAVFSAPSFEGSPQAFSLPAMTFDAAIREDKLDAKAKLAGALSGDIDKMLFTSPQLTLTLSGKQGDTAIDGSLATPLHANLAAQTVELSRLAADFSLPNPGGGTLKLKAGGNVNINLGKKTAAAQLDGNLDQSVFKAKLGLSNFSPLMYTFDIGIDQLDLDRYRSKAAPPKSGGGGKAPAAEQPMDFSALQKLHAAGSMRIGALKAANIRSSNVRVDMRAADGKLDISPITANLYGGSVSSVLTVIAANPARFAARQILSGVSIGPLLKDAIDKNPLEGKGNVQLDVSTHGATTDQLKKGLNGSARLELHDGAIRGVNIAQTIREAKTRLGQLRGDEKPQAGTASTSEKTDFSEMTASFRIVNGIAHNDDLNIKSPLVRVAGAGDINLGEDKLDYVARTTVVSSLQGQGGPELQALKGVTVPVRLSGPFTAIGWQVDFAGLATELAKQKFKEEAQGKAQKSLDEQKEKVRGQLQNQLKGLFGK